MLLDDVDPTDFSARHTAHHVQCGETDIIIDWPKRQRERNKRKKIPSASKQ